ncbi:BlaI/MecI/CopY family transcriptional regulator [Streptomyces sp. MNU76]|uniref:BlaI/MecI/CopY family transcriptional regulator n=1 Tax=Streptomyces sp. MNU76 TaxID=2560026 RepID=UPI001E28F8B2|nr:BlaI/MecI/CopY family transcriptional regulator [Streptomyces sp. MNU76]MCC9710524.1 BlaI/MecI/CopY family transcriptional regulator [Streptomyces sp. MNU76]
MPAALVGAPGPVTAGWVREQVDPALACTTVVTTLTRSHGRQVVVRRREGRSSVWGAVVDAAGPAARCMHQVLDEESDRGALLSRFVAEPSPDEERSLRLRLGPPQARAPAVDGPPCRGGPRTRLVEVDIWETASGGRAAGSVR